MSFKVPFQLKNSDSNPCHILCAYSKQLFHLNWISSLFERKIKPEVNTL